MGTRILTILVGVALAGCAVAPSPSAPSQSQSPPTSLASPSVRPTATPLPEGTLSPALPPTALDLDRYTWRMVVAELDLKSSLLLGWWISVGTLARIEPTWQGRIAIPAPVRNMTFDDFPVVAGPNAGRVLYVSDDGQTSSVRLIDTLARTERLVVQTADRVVAARLAPTGDVAYLSLSDRATAVDLGVFDLRFGEPIPKLRHVLGVPSFGASAGADSLSTVHRSDRQLRVSPDGTMVARRACSPNGKGCALDVLDIGTGVVTDYSATETSGTAGPPPLEELLAIGNGWVIGNIECAADSTCAVESALNLDTRTFRPISPTQGSHTVGVDQTGDLNFITVMGNFDDSYGAYVLATSLRTLVTRLVLVTKGTAWFQLYSYTPDLELELPHGWFYATLCPSDGVTCPQAAVRLMDGGWVPIALPTVVARVKGRDF